MGHGSFFPVPHLLHPKEEPHPLKDLNPPPLRAPQGTPQTAPGQTRTPPPKKSPRRRARARARTNPTAPGAGGAPPPTTATTASSPIMRSDASNARPSPCDANTKHPPPTRHPYRQPPPSLTPTHPNHNTPNHESTQPPPVGIHYREPTGSASRTSQRHPHPPPPPLPTTIHHPLIHLPCPPDAHTCSRPSTSRHRSHLFARPVVTLPVASGLTPVRPHSFLGAHTSSPQPPLTRVRSNLHHGQSLSTGRSSTSTIHPESQSSTQRSITEIQT